MKVQPIYYDWKEADHDKGFGNERQLGFSAQELEQYFPEMVHTSGDGYKGINYSRMTPVLVQVVNELKKENDEKQRQIDELQRKIEELFQLVKNR